MADDVAIAVGDFSGRRRGQRRKGHYNSIGRSTFGSWGKRKNCSIQQALSGGSRISQTEGRTPGFGSVTSQRQLSILRNRITRPQEDEKAACGGGDLGETW